MSKDCAKCNGTEEVTVHYRNKYNEACSTVVSCDVCEQKRDKNIVSMFLSESMYRHENRVHF